MVMGEGKKPGLEHLIMLGVDAKIDRTNINGIIEQTRHALNQWMPLAKEYGVSQRNIELINNKIRTCFQ